MNCMLGEGGGSRGGGCMGGNGLFGTCYWLLRCCCDRMRRVRRGVPDRV